MPTQYGGSWTDKPLPPFMRRSSLQSIPSTLNYNVKELLSLEDAHQKESKTDINQAKQTKRTNKA